MKIVIDIPESEIPKQQDIIEIPLHFIDGKVCEAGGYGFDVLPKGHGRLIDADDIMNDIKNDINEMTNLGLAVTCDYLWGKINDAIYNAPTIIESDKE